jgi:hypothetical protein
MFREDYPPGGYEVLSKPPLGKCSIYIIKQAFRLRWAPEGPGITVEWRCTTHGGDLEESATAAGIFGYRLCNNLHMTTSPV